MSDIREELAWAAGVMSARGGFVIAKTGRAGRTKVPAPSYRLAYRGTEIDQGEEILKRFTLAVGMGMRVNRSWGTDPLIYVQVTGSRMHELMGILWPWLTSTRKLDYIDLRRGCGLPEMTQSEHGPVNGL